MCGIAGFHLKDEGFVRNHSQMERFANLLLEGIESRGRQAAGFVAVTNDGKKIEIDKRAVNAKEFVKVRKALPVGTRTFLGHTRLATQGSNENNANLHPVVAGTCFLTHNGSIWNDDELFKEHDLERHAEVDTEIIPALIHKFGWKNAAKALHELKGGFAVAAIDVKHPGEVLLAKGDWNPLAWIETDNFIVWASTVSAIRDAWKEVLGTPPAWKKFSNLSEGDILWIKDKVIEPAKFELPTDPFRRKDDPKRQSAGTSTPQRAIGPGQMRSIFERHSRSRAGGASGSYSTDSARGVVIDRRDAVRTLREDGYGKAIIYRLTSHEQALEASPGGLTWQTCPGCDELILAVSFVYRTGEGKICTDCNYVAENPGDKLVIDADTKKELTDWVKRELRAHTPALFAVAKQADLDVCVVDYMVFRLPEKAAKEKPGYADLAAALDDLYQEAHAHMWDNVLDAENARGSEDEKPWHIKDNVHPITAKYATERCKDCGRWKVHSKACVWCLKKVTVTTEDKGNTKIDVSKCWCGEQADKVVGGLAGFCFYHYINCNEEKCEWGISAATRNRGIRAKANHILTSGRRVCHHHARGKQGAFSDTLLKQKGVRVHERIHEPAGL